MVGEDKTRIILTLEKELKEKLTINAKSQNRTVNNLITTILIEWQKKQEQAESDTHVS